MTKKDNLLKSDVRSAVEAVAKEYGMDDTAESHYVAVLHLLTQAMNLHDDPWREAYVTILLELGREYSAFAYKTQV